MEVLANRSPRISDMHRTVTKRIVTIPFVKTAVPRRCKIYISKVNFVKTFSSKIFTICSIMRYVLVRVSLVIRSKTLKFFLS